MLPQVWEESISSTLWSSYSAPSTQTLPIPAKSSITPEECICHPNIPAGIVPYPLIPVCPHSPIKGGFGMCKPWLWALTHIQTGSLCSDTASDAQLIILYEAQNHTSHGKIRRYNLSAGTEVSLDTCPAPTPTTARSYCHTHTRKWWLRVKSWTSL